MVPGWVTVNAIISVTRIQFNICDWLMALAPVSLLPGSIPLVVSTQLKTQLTAIVKHRSLIHQRLNCHQGFIIVRSKCHKDSLLICNILWE